MPTALERAGDFSQTRDALGRPVQLVDPATGPAVRRQRDSAGADQPAGGVAAGLLPAAERRRRRPLQLSDAGARDQASGRGPGPVLAVAVRRTQPAVRQPGAAAHDDRRGQRVRLHRLEPRVRRRHDRQLVAPLLAVLLAAPALSVHAADDGRDAVLREPHQRVRRRRHRRQQSGSGRTGARRACCSRAASPASAARRPRRTATGRTAPAPRSCRRHGRHNITFGGDVRRQQLERAVAAGRARHVRLHGRGHGLRSRRLPARPSAHQLDRVRQRRQDTSRGRPTTPTSPTTGG